MRSQLGVRILSHPPFYACAERHYALWRTANILDGAARAPEGDAFGVPTHLHGSTEKLRKQLKNLRLVQN